jgi:hypothetical protein
MFIGRSLATNVSSGFIVPVFQLPCHNIHLQLLYASWAFLVHAVFKKIPQKKLENIRLGDMCAHSSLEMILSPRKSVGV